MLSGSCGSRPKQHFSREANFDRLPSVSPRTFWLLLAAVAALTAIGVYLGTAFAAGTVEGCSDYGGGREGSSAEMDRSLFPPTLECSFTGPNGNVRELTRGWPAGGWIALGILVLAGGALLMAARSGRRPTATT